MLRRLLALAFVTCTASGIVLATACSTNDVEPAPPVEPTRLCDPGLPVIPCEAGPPVKGLCVGDRAAANNVRLLPTDAGFAPGCRGYFPALDCSALDNCYCRAGDDDASASWICEKP